MGHDEHRRKSEETRAIYRELATQKLAEKVSRIDKGIASLFKGEEYSISTGDLLEIGRLVIQERTGLLVHTGDSEMFVNSVRNPYIE